MTEKEAAREKDVNSSSAGGMNNSLLNDIRVLSLLVDMKLEDFIVKDSFSFHLSGYKNKRENDETFFSPSFYFAQYHLGIVVYANGDEEGWGDYVSVYVSILKGKHDTRVKWPLIGKITFRLLNQLENKNHHIQRMLLESTDDARVGTEVGVHLTPHSELAHDPDQNTQYLKGDTLFFGVSVEVADYKPWLERTPK